MSAVDLVQSTDRVHWVADTCLAPDEAWRCIAAHHLLTSRHLPEATMSIIGVTEEQATTLRRWAVDLGLSGLRIPDSTNAKGRARVSLVRPGNDSACDGLIVDADVPPTVLCEVVALLIERHPDDLDQG